MNGPVRWYSAALMALLLLAGCGGDSTPAQESTQQAPAAGEPAEDTVSTNPEADFPAALAAARERHQQAMDLEFAWSRAETLIESAENAAAAGDFAGALEMAIQAEKFAALSIEQATTEAEAWQARVP
ncbi:MAG: hypothetical protein QNJ40_18785 [Xanthomonadales bacterium]|nr:hypothetical protein [Xanthomonadales bacterium]